MTPGVTSSPITLLTAPTDAAAGTAASGAQAPAGAGGSGFEQLLAQAAQAVRSGLSLLVSGTAAAPANKAAAQPVADADGNPLPLPGATLPVVALDISGIAADSEDAGAQEETGADDASAGDESSEAAALAAALLAMPAPLSTPAAAKPAPATAAGDGAVMLGVPAAALPAAAKSTAATGADEEPAAALDIAAFAGDEQPAKPENHHAAKASAAAANPVRTAAAPAIDARSAAIAPPVKPGEADFDALVKQLEGASAPSNTTQPATAAIDGGRIAPPLRPPAAAATATVSIPVAAEGWSEAVADKVMWFSASKISSAEIHLNPPDLGPLQVKISTQQDQTSVVFNSQHAAVRDALDQNLPRLRDMLGGQGIQLADVGVGNQGHARQQDFRGQGENHSPSSRHAFAHDGDSTEAVAVTAVAAARLARAGIDAYA